jgi:hypothetical protein
MPPGWLRCTPGEIRGGDLVAVGATPEMYNGRPCVRIRWADGTGSEPDSYLDPEHTCWRMARPSERES